FPSPEAGRGTGPRAAVSSLEPQPTGMPYPAQPLDGRSPVPPAKGLLIGVMLAAVAAGALLAWILVGR
ncbi:MAG TPA: hypothetical protein VJ801_15065, partial [Polyangia bacterium]|nr:hypothetical protein [Polyangia bacterium]